MEGIEEENGLLNATLGMNFCLGNFFINFECSGSVLCLERNFVQFEFELAKFRSNVLEFDVCSNLSKNLKILLLRTVHSINKTPSSKIIATFNLLSNSIKKINF